jgi:anti-anti-sigma regulatory factor
MKYSIKKCDGGTVVSLHGDCTDPRACELKEALLEIVDKGEKIIVFDLEGVRDCNCTGLNMLLDVIRLIIKRDATPRVTCPIGGKVDIFLRMIKFIPIIQMFNFHSVEDALTGNVS